MFGKLTISEIDELLAKQLVGRLGCHANGVTYVVPVSYAYDGQFVYVHSFEGRKVNMLRNNPDVCFQVDDTRDLSNWKSAVCWGVYEELEDKSDRDTAIEKLNARILPVISSETMHVSPVWPFTDDSEQVHGVVFRIRVTEKTGRFEKSAEVEFYAS
ncbi:MAG: pyridoxamine 5'-phosphate oxidase family protein [Chitinophagaceae bacterium]|nr:pyridoxamine 5'-phosphate oxidase family protein [Chitinophagaceae bacterium]